MFRNLFRPDSPLMIVMSQITDCIFLSLFWILGCFPVITAGASFTALYDAIYQGFRRGNKNSWQYFLASFRRNLKDSILPCVIVLFLGSLLIWVLIRIWNAAVYGTISWMVFSGAALVGCLVVGMLSLLFPMLSRFDNSMSALFGNTVLLSLSHLPRCLLLGAMNAAALVLCVYFVVPLFFLPGLVALLSTWIIEPMFRPYLPKETDPEDAA